MRASSTARGFLLLACAAAAAADPYAMDRADDGRPAAGALDGWRRLNQKQKKKLAATADIRMNVAAGGRFGAVADASDKTTKQETRQAAREEARAEKQEASEKQRKKEGGVNERKQKKKRKRKKRSGKSGKATHAPSVSATHTPTMGKSDKGTLAPTVHVTKAPSTMAPSGAKAEKGAKAAKEFTSFPTVSGSEFPTISSPTTNAPTRNSDDRAVPGSHWEAREPYGGAISGAHNEHTEANGRADIRTVFVSNFEARGWPYPASDRQSLLQSDKEPHAGAISRTNDHAANFCTDFVSDSPTPEPTEVELSCPDTLDRLIIDSEAILHYAAVEPVPAGASNGIFCGRLEVTGLKGWLGFAISEDDKMAGSTAIIGEYAEGTVLKYDLEPVRQVIPAPEERQTLRDASISQEGGRTVMSFTKLLVEDEDVPIVLGTNFFLHARGDGALGYHGPNRWDFEVNLGETAPPTPEPTPLPTASPSKSPSTYLPTFYPTSATIAPTAVPAGALYFNGFEKGFLADYDEWTTSGDPDDNWMVSIRNAESGKYSVRAPDLGLNNTEKTPGESTLTLTTNASWGAGTLHWSMLAGAQMPLDIVELHIDGAVYDPGFDWMGRTEFEPFEVSLDPGSHTVEWIYKYNPLMLPPESLPPGEIRDRVFIDEVYFLEDAATPSPGPTTTAPTSVPDGATYFIDFEKGSYPELELDREDDGDWFLSNEKSETGVFALRSPDLYNEEGASVSANFTFGTGPDWPAGIIHWSELAGTRMPLDAVTFYVDGNQRGPLRQGMTTFEETSTGLGPGSHEITFEYQFNPNDTPAVGLPPPEFSGRTSYFVDRIYFVPLSADATNPAPSPDSTDTEMPTYWPTFSPTLAPTEADMMMP